MIIRQMQPMTSQPELIRVSYSKIHGVNMSSGYEAKMASHSLAASYLFRLGSL